MKQFSESELSKLDDLLMSGKISEEEYKARFSDLVRGTSETVLTTHPQKDKSVSKHKGIILLMLGFLLAIIIIKGMDIMKGKVRDAGQSMVIADKVTADNERDVNDEYYDDALTSDMDYINESESNDILERIGYIYNYVLNTKYYLLDKDVLDSFYSREYLAISEEGNKLAEGYLWGVECDFWTRSQDPGDKPILSNAEIIKFEGDKVFVKCSIDTGYGDQLITVLSLVKENSIWLADDSLDENFEHSYKQINLESVISMRENN